MSLTQEITKVVQAANNLTQAVMNKIGQIDRRVVQIENTAKDAVFSEMNKTVYLDNVNGKDSNPGTENSPIRSFSCALKMIPAGGKVNIICQSDMTNLYGYDANLKSYQMAIISDGKSVSIDLGQHTWYVKTCQKLLWSDYPNADDYIQINQHIHTDANSKLYISNGDIRVDYASETHKKLKFLDHPTCRGLQRISNGFIHNYETNFYCTVPDVSIFSLDGWTGTQGDALLNKCNIYGVGCVRVAGNSDVTLDDLNLCKRTVTFDETFTNN
ncbi:hypothetical protein [Vibrio quintilis]|uniref:Uncharacterized protein n=1 Tax=Vibrio quintilis TaxID=1117707 RepID=A0A1M7YYZ7_9VIBR|nr:hypothetical protein [Vibrio quintilis]SHO57772.1 hypothetical protein VQ7734_03542 [Vibrio quintilis]